MRPYRPLKRRSDDASTPAPKRRGRINVYTCPRGHQTITRDWDDGTTPITILCSQGGYTCLQTAFSAWYDADQALMPTHEWYRPTMRYARRLDRRVPGTLDHVERGGLLLRRISETQLAEIAAERIGRRVATLDRKGGTS